VSGFSFSFFLFFFCFFVFCLFVFLWIKCKLHGKKHGNGGNQYYKNRNTVIILKQKCTSKVYIEKPSCHWEVNSIINMVLALTILNVSITSYFCWQHMTHNIFLQLHPMLLEPVYTRCMQSVKKLILVSLFVFILSLNHLIPFCSFSLNASQFLFLHLQEHMETKWDNI
jgi:hypothetical protein